MKDYFTVQKKILLLVGVPLSSFSMKQKCYCYLLYLTLIGYVSVMIPEFFQEKSFDDRINDLMFGTGYIVVTVKVSAFFLNREKLVNILTTFQTGVFLPNKQRGGITEQAWIKETVHFTKLQSASGSILGCITIIACIVASWRSSEKKLPFGSLLITKYYSYEWVLFFQTIVSEMAMLQFMMIDVLYASILAHICLQCKMLQNSIKRMISNSICTAQEELDRIDITDSSEIPWKYLENAIKDVVVYHKSIIKLSDEVEDVFSLPTLTVFSSMSLCICFILYQSSIYPLLDFKFIRSFVILITSIATLSLGSFWSSKLIFESLAIADSVYEVDFVGTDVRFQKALKLILQRSQKPIKMTVGKFADLSLVTMIGICRLSYSYFTLLRNINEN